VYESRREPATNGGRQFLPSPGQKLEKSADTISDTLEFGASKVRDPALDRANQVGAGCRPGAKKLYQTRVFSGTFIPEFVGSGFIVATAKRWTDRSSGTARRGPRFNGAKALPS
jgi:hypothetical protein